MKLGWLAHLARHAPLNARVNYAVGSSPTGSITKQVMKQFQSVKCCIHPRRSQSNAIERRLAIELIEFNHSIGFRLI